MSCCLKQSFASKDLHGEKLVLNNSVPVFTLKPSNSGGVTFKVPVGLVPTMLHLLPTVVFCSFIYMFHYDIRAEREERIVETHILIVGKV